MAWVGRKGLSAIATAVQGMSAPEEEFYSQERWANWLTRIEEEPLDPDDEDAARLLLNLQDDVAIAVAKILNALNEDLDPESALEELTDIRDIVLGDIGIDDEETALLVDGVQTSLVAVFLASEQYITEGVADEGDIEEYLEAAADAEAQEDFDQALGLVAAAGTHVIDGRELDMEFTEELEYGLVTEWINGLHSLEGALADPEVIEE